MASTLIGGASYDVAEDVAVDSAGRAFVVGHTLSDDFPTTAGAFQTEPGSAPASRDAFAVGLPVAADALAFSTFLGGSAEDLAFAVTVDGAGRPVVTGATESANFPTTPGAHRRTPAGLEDAFVTALAANGASLAWSTYLGGSSSERGLDVALDRDGRPVVVGPTCSEDLPVPSLPFDGAFNGPCDAYVSKLGSDGSFVAYGSYVGGWYDETVFAVAVADPEAVEQGDPGGGSLASRRW